LNSQQENDRFRCIIHNFIDENRYFHQFQTKELQLVAHLFGMIIQNQLVSSITLGIALRYVLEALRKDPRLDEANEKSFMFGRIALEQYRERIQEWPQYASHLMQIDHFQGACPDLYNEAQIAIGGLSNPNRAAEQNYESPSTEPHMLVQGMSYMEITNSTNESVGSDTIPTGGSTDTSDTNGNVGDISNVPSQPISQILEVMKVKNPEVTILTIPADTVKDQIHFIINNIAKSNADQKSNELKKVLTPDLFVWFSNTLVKQRISSQPNLHPLYLTMLDIINNPDLHKTILACVFHEVTMLLQSPKITTSSSERSLLRNLGIWLGQATLARNKVLLHRNVQLKELLYWGYEGGRALSTEHYDVITLYYVLM
jgi:CCR4-NOT transcription complex subunit 1